MQIFHQAVHSTDTDVNAIITLKNVSDFISTKPFVIISEDLQNGFCDCLIFFGAISRFSAVMLVISASVDTKNFAEKFDVMLETKFMYGF